LVTYNSKREIYRAGFPIALKFVPSFRVRCKANYQKLFDSLAKELRVVVTKFSDDVKNFDIGPSSQGFLFEVPAEKGGKKAVRRRYVLLPHETGLEVVIPATVLTAAGTWVLLEIIKKILGIGVDFTVKRLIRFLRDNWTQNIDPEGGYRIEAVEVRTESKGVGTIPFSSFRFSQVLCLLSRYERVSTIFDCNEKCFGGKLKQAPGNHPSYGEVVPNARD
jgi:hypothetical protein